MCWPIFCSASLNSSICRCSALLSDPLAALFSASSLVLTSLLTSSGILASLSLITFSAWWIMWSAWLRSSTSSRLARSSAECASASLTIRSTSSLFRVEEAVIVTDCSRPVPVLRLDVEDAVGVEVEGDLDLGHAPGRGRNAVQVEAAQRAVVARHLALALEHVDLHGRLAVGRGREDLRPRGWDRRIAVDELGRHPAQGLDAERKRRHVQEQDVLDLALEHAGLDRCADGDDLVRVDALVRLLAAEQVLDQLLDDRHAGRAPDQHDFVDLLGREVGVLQRGQERPAGALRQV